MLGSLTLPGGLMLSCTEEIESVEFFVDIASNALRLEGNIQDQTTKSTVGKPIPPKNNLAMPPIKSPAV